MKTITEKLNLNKFTKKLVVARPSEDYLTDFEDFDEKPNSNDKSYDLIFAFVESKEDFLKKFSENRDRLAIDGLFYIAYPKKGNKKFESYVHRDELFSLLQADSETGFIKDSSLKFNRMVALDDIYTVIGIKNAEKELKKAKKSSKVSGRVADYVEKLPDLRAILAKEKLALEFFENLTPGYQKDWARYIYSAKTEATQQKRTAEMFAAFANGFKFADAYKQSLK
ncbi:MAG: YdeI/OmpD-associated family protein [Streptococcaceae bacterium]|jgi:hypothetical protein|nr:YdeI/OmpD-associated family protein [Streptococcaceae bacterium]